MQGIYLNIQAVYLNDQAYVPELFTVYPSMNRLVMKLTGILSVYHVATDTTFSVTSPQHTISCLL